MSYVDETTACYRTGGGCGPHGPCDAHNRNKPAPSPPLPEVGSRWTWNFAPAKSETVTVVSVGKGMLAIIDEGDMRWEIRRDTWKAPVFTPIPPAPAAEPNSAHEAQQPGVTSRSGREHPQYPAPGNGKAAGVTPAVGHFSCLCADDGPGHWDARCPLACWSTGHKFMTCDRCEACGVTGKELRQKERKRACVCLSRDCGECGPKLERERLIAIAGSPWGGLMAWLPEKP